MSNTASILPVVSSLVLQVQPSQLSMVSDSIGAFPHVEIYGTDNTSKVVVVVEAANDADLAELMSVMGAMNGVITVNMVFHHTDYDTTPNVNGVVKNA